MFFYMRGSFELTRLTDSENLTILLFSVLYTINIAISNVSLYVSIRHWHLYGPNHLPHVLNHPPKSPNHTLTIPY